MSWGLRVLWQGIGALGLLVSGAGCSFVNERPPWAPALHSERGMSKCGSIWYPLLDSTFVLTGGTSVLLADSSDDARRVPNGYDARTQVVTYSEPQSTGWTRVQRGLGYTTMIVFGASAIYGFVAETRCYWARKEVAGRKDGAAEDAPQRKGFPGGLFAFRFGMSPAEAAQACRSMNHEWSAEASTAVCKAPVATSTDPDIRVGFGLAALASLTLEFEPKGQNTRRDYESVEDSLRRMYGSPQVEAAPLSTACQESLAHCLADGEHPRGPVWHWPTGSIELTATSRDDKAVIDLRYLRED